MISFFRIPSESPNMRKISLMLEETALPYVVQLVEPRQHENRLACYGSILDKQLAGREYLAGQYSIATWRAQAFRRCGVYLHDLF